MAELAATTLDYENYHIFVGTYPNDPDTQRDVDEVCARFPNVHKVVCARPGPTSKADCLNNVLDPSPSLNVAPISLLLVLFCMTPKM